MDEIIVITDLSSDKAINNNIYVILLKYVGSYITEY